MLPSLPLLEPRDAYTLWYSPSSTFSFAPPTQHYSDASQQLNNPSSSSSGLLNPNTSNARPTPKYTGISPVAQLAQDEASVEARKRNIQLFGATWIKPPGFAKTYQGELDEKAEREEADAQMQDGDVTQFGFEDGAGEEIGDEDGEEEEDEEQDLDDEIPEADEDLGSEDDFGELDEDEEDVDLDADVPDAEAETLWGDSDEELDEEEEEEGEDDEEESFEQEEGSEAGYASRGIDDATISSSTRASTTRTEDSPQPAGFSHDEARAANGQPRRPQADGFDWRGISRSSHQRRPDDSMEIDSD